MMGSCLTDDQVGEIIQKIQVFVFPRRIRCREFYNDYDPLRSGRCTKTQMCRAITMMNFTGMDDNERDLLVEYFTDHGPNVVAPQVVDYMKFCQLVDEVYVEGSPDPLQSASSPGTTMMCSFVPNSIEDEDQVMHILHRVATLCKTRGVCLKYCFTDFANAPVPHPPRPNPRRGGKITAAQFARLFPFTKDFGESEMDILMQRYMTKGGDVHFQALHNDVSAVADSAMIPFPTSPLVLRPDHTQWSHSELTPVDKIRAKVVEKRIRMYEHFQDYDPLRKGFCTVGQVKTTMTVLNIAREIGKADFDKLAYAYMREDGMFCYADFCADVDKGFTSPYLEKDPLQQVSMPDPSTTAGARRNTINVSSEKRKLISDLEDKIRTRVRLRRVLLKPFFQDSDRSKRGFITRNQFQRAMTSLQFTLSEFEVGMLCGVYCNFGNHLDFNYVDFVHCVDPNEDSVVIADAQASAPYQDYEPSKYFDTAGRVIRMDNAAFSYA